MVALALLALTLTGCEAFSYLSTMGGEKVSAVYPLADRPTLVMVEDPDNALGDPTLSRVIANHVNHHLSENEAVQSTLVSQAELVALAERLDEEYRQMPIDRVGQQLGAEQVVHVLIDRVQLTSAPGMYRPTAQVEVKVIDAAESRRLFPSANRVEDRSAPPGHRLQTQMDYIADNGGGAGVEPAMMRALAEQVALDVAQLFYDHREAEPGSRLR
ncbi:MAG: hypothetical protein WD534_01860 [Phycisphaeraceae bacterium]